MAKFNTVRQGELLLSGGAWDNHIQAVSELPDPLETDTGSVYFLTEYSRNCAPGRIYILRDIEGEKKWWDLAIQERGKLAAPTGFWKRITSDSIALHWEDPEDTVDPEDSFNNATWDHDVIIRKYATTEADGPQNIYDGEIVGYSTVRNQYKEGLGFVHGPIDVEDTHYYYRVFSVTKGGVATPTTLALRTSWTWPEIHEIVQMGNHREIFRVGDIFPMPEHKVYGTLHARIVDFDRNGTQSITFMIEEVIGCGREGQEENIMFDNKELEFAATKDTNVKANKTYYDDDLNPFDPEDFDEDEPYQIGAPIRRVFPDADVIYEEHPATRYFVNLAANGTEKAQRLLENCTECGSNIWSQSNLRQWLSSTVAASGSLLDENFDYTHTEYSGYTSGWFQSSTYFDLAPATPEGVHYTDTIPFMAGFVESAQEEFLQYIVAGLGNTNLNNYDAGRNTSVTDDAVTVGKSNNELISLGGFWLPSFSEVYGTVATKGKNGIDEAPLEEGSTFRYFISGGQDARVRYGYFTGRPCNWMLRSPDRTTVSSVYYVPGYTVDPADQDAICLSCSAFKLETDTLKVGICPCFNFG